MPSTYDPNAALPLRVPPDVRARLDALTARLPPASKAPRNTVAVAALVRGLEVLERALDHDPFAVQRAFAGEPPLAPPQVQQEPAATSSRAPAARPARPGAPPSKGTRAPVEGKVAPELAGDVDPLRARWLAVPWGDLKLSTRAACVAAKANRSSVQAWLTGANLSAGQRALVAAYLDKIAPPS